MTINKIRYSTLAAALVLTIISSALASAQTRLSARKNKVINGIEAELRGNYRENLAPARLDADLEDINVPLGTKVAFCVLQNGVRTLVGVGKVVLLGGAPTASIDLSVNDGDVVPNINPGDVLQARQRTVAPFNSNPTCSSPLMVSAAFQQ